MSEVAKYRVTHVNGVAIYDARVASVQELKQSYPDGEVTPLDADGNEVKPLPKTKAVPAPKKTARKRAARESTAKKSTARKGK